ncbi:MAG: hypothetical protein EON51_17225, partial [Acinetobacter sp.]
MKNFKFSAVKGLLSLMLIILAFSTKAQVAKTVVRNFNFKIDYVYYGKADSVYLFIYEGGKLGVKVGQQGKVFGTYSSEKPNRSQKELGFSTVVKLMGDTIIAKTTLYKPTIADEKAMENDYLSLDINLPQNNYNSLLYDLALMQITFLDNSRGKLYSLKQILTKDSKALEDSIINKSIIDIKSIYDMVKDDDKYK